MYDYNSSSPKLNQLPLCRQFRGISRRRRDGEFHGILAHAHQLHLHRQRGDRHTGGITDVTNSTPALINCILWGDVSPSTSEIYAIDSTKHSDPEL